MQELFDRAEALGVAVIEEPLPYGVRGEYIHERRLIRLAPSMSYRQKRSTLGHELGHAHFGHTSPQSEAECRLQERQANDYAAQLLVTPADYAAAEALHGPHIGNLAFHLGVTPAVITSWRSWWCRGGLPIAG